MSYRTSSKQLPPFWLLIGQKNTKVSWHQSEAITAATVWNWSGKTLSPAQGLFSPFFTFPCAIFFRPFRLSLAPTICPWVPEDVTSLEEHSFPFSQVKDPPIPQEDTTIYGLYRHVPSSVQWNLDITKGQGTCGKICSL